MNVILLRGTESPILPKSPHLLQQHIFISFPSFTRSLTPLLQTPHPHRFHPTLQFVRTVSPFHTSFCFATTRCPTSWRNSLKSPRSWPIRATLSLFALTIPSMLPPIRVLCRLHFHEMMRSLKASMQPEYSHIVDAAVQYAKVWSVV